MSVFETERLNYNFSDDVYAIHTTPLGRDSQRSKRISAILLASLGLVSCLSLVLSIVAIVRTGDVRNDVVGQVQPGSTSGPPTDGNATSQTANQQQFLPTRRVAFGSCTSKDLRPQPIWAQGVVPAQPDAWIWLGDFAYLDTSPVSCNLNDTRSLPGCNCTAGHMSYPGQCLAGDVDAARERWVHAVHNLDYRAFLDYMCPPLHGAAAAAAASHSGLAGFGAEPGRFPPAGTDPAVCPRPILGVYDDHDFGWNNGNRRLPNKAEFKRMFLDAVGEAPGSARRRADAGLQAVYTLNGGGPGRDIDVVLLDERWYRDPLPCSLRQDWCQKVLQNPADPMYGWCRDFLLDDGTTGRGSCCTKDQDMATWCSLPSSRDAADPALWRAACDPTSSDWGRLPLVLGPDNATLLRADDERLWTDEQQQAALWPRLLQAHESPVCEVLGAAQRSWLSDHLAASTAPLTLLVSSSVPLGSVNFTDPATGNSCSGDDWDCWQPAQLNLLHTLANTSSGCVVVLTGDYHYSDIKVLAPGGRTPYAAAFQTNKIKKHIYQVMASGLTESTAHHEGLPCEGTYREDLLGLRPLGRCALTSRPNFGLVEVDWEGGVVHLTIRDAEGGGTATSQEPNGSSQHVAFSLKTCAPV